MQGFGPILVDGHVHLYPEFDTARTLAAAAAGLAAAGRAAGLARAPAVLLLTETPRETGFADLARGPLPAGWRARDRDPQDPALVLEPAAGGPPLIVVAGRQIRTAERIEVLALASAAPPPAEGMPLDAVLAALAEAAVPAVLPWGVGKWLGARGRRVAAALEAHPGVFLGDNAGRPPGWPAPALFARARVLPGTDPLPHRGAEAGVGRYGFVLDGPIDPARPGAAIRAALLALAASPRPVGARVGVAGFVTGQVRMRLG